MNPDNPHKYFVLIWALELSIGSSNLLSVHCRAAAVVVVGVAVAVVACCRRCGSMHTKGHSGACIAKSSVYIAERLQDGCRGHRRPREPQRQLTSRVSQKK